jgi:hypothetical protein
MSTISSQWPSYTTPSAWDQIQAWHDSQTAWAQDQETLQATAGSFADASINQASSMGDIVAKIAAKRLGLDGSTSSTSSTSTSPTTTALMDYESFLAAIDQAANPDMADAVNSAADTKADPANGNTGALGFESLMASFDQAAGLTPTPASTASSSSTFDFSQFLANLTMVAATGKGLAGVNVTA